MKLVYLRIKPEYENKNMYKYLVYNSKKDIDKNNIAFIKEFYNFRNINDMWYDIITEEEFKLEAL